ncbi:DUF4350 domain-containing protein [Nocardioides mangrovicus]|uniref:DUF4350 domain-containing protein n=1 Tax=Nocardioides mangrovicus TaxID=2478913 RepID=A0A3L8P5U9_9ACTN|nr:DUF4350 domain-containing protein [Nocardioides mangrovicus]RLV50625.1 DUF4350 domain-containing protein [Nocardioides mangrovicus]
MTDFARRHRTALVLLLMVVVLVAGVSWLQRDRAQYDGALDPRNPDPTGAQAVARVLADRGVAVDIARGQSALLADDVDAGTSVVVTNADTLGRSTLQRLRSHASRARSLVLVGTSSTLLTAFDLHASGAASGLVDSGCRTRVLQGLVARLHDAAALSGRGCFRAGGGVVVARPARGIWLVTAPELFRNDRVLQGDNAAVALRLLGQQPRLVWYVADPADTVAADAVSVRTFLPDWLIPALWLLAAALVAFLLWRGRRLGPLVSEPVPVVVRATEATSSRGRLYRRARDRDHAAAILRSATRRRVAERLALSDPDRAADALPAALADQGTLLRDSPVRDDAALAELGRGLTQLEDDL